MNIVGFMMILDRTNGENDGYPIFRQTLTLED